MNQIKFNKLPLDMQARSGKANPYILGRYILGYTKLGREHIRWAKWVVKNIDPNNLNNLKALKLLPRETFKSTFFTDVLCIWLLINNPNLSILIANEVFSNAMDFLKEIKGKLLSDKFVEVYGDLRTADDWSARSITLSTRTSVSKESSIMCAGIGVALVSKHFDIVLADDIAGVKDRDSTAGRKATMNFFGDIWDLLKKDKSLFLMVGTRWNLSDIYYHIINVVNPRLIAEGLAPFDVEVKPAYDNGGKIIDFNNFDESKLNFPDILDKKKLLELRALKDISMFMAQYQLNPLSDAEQIFKVLHFIDVEKEKFSHFIVWTDPALSEKSSACYSAIVAIGKIEGGEHGGKWAVVYTSIDRREPSRLINDHNNMYIMIEDKHKCPVDILMEQNGFQVLLKREAISQSVEGGRSVPTVGRTAKENKEARIKALEPFTSEGLLLFREDWQTARGNYRLLIEQLRNYPQAEKDAPDALAGAFKTSRSRHF